MMPNSFDIRSNAFDASEKIPGTVHIAAAAAAAGRSTAAAAAPKPAVLARRCPGPDWKVGDYGSLVF